MRLIDSLLSIRPRAWLILPLLICSAMTRAEVVDLHNATVLVPSQSQDDRRDGASRGLAEVVVRATGNEDYLNDNHVKLALSQAQSYLLEFNYRVSDRTLEIDGASHKAFELNLKFSAQAINNLLRRAGARIWPANRRSVLVWLVLDDAIQGRQMMSVTDSSATQKALDYATYVRGIPTVAPLLDLEDHLKLTPDQLWNLDEQAIRDASARYGADSILVGRYSTTSMGDWLGSWTLLADNNSETFTSDGQNLQTFFLDSFSELARYFSYRDGVLPSVDDGSDAAIVMEVAGVYSFQAFINTLSYLDGLEIVRAAQVVSVDDDVLRINLFTDGGTERLVDTVALDRRLQPVSYLPQDDYQPAVGEGLSRLPGSKDNPLLYRWPG